MERKERKQRIRIRVFLLFYVFSPWWFQTLYLFWLTDRQPWFRFVFQVILWIQETDWRLGSLDPSRFCFLQSLSQRWGYKNSKHTKPHICCCCIFNLGILFNNKIREDILHLSFFFFFLCMSALFRLGQLRQEGTARGWHAKKGLAWNQTPAMLMHAPCSTMWATGAGHIQEFYAWKREYFFFLASLKEKLFRRNLNPRGVFKKDLEMINNALFIDFFQNFS